MLYAILLFFFVGLVTGALFKVRCLLLALLIVLGQVLYLGFETMWVATYGAVMGIIAMQVGYVAGLFSRATLAQASQLMAAR